MGGGARGRRGGRSPWRTCQDRSRSAENIRRAVNTVRGRSQRQQIVEQLQASRAVSRGAVDVRAVRTPARTSGRLQAIADAADAESETNAHHSSWGVGGRSGRESTEGRGWPKWQGGAVRAVRRARAVRDVGPWHQPHQSPLQTRPVRYDRRHTYRAHNLGLVMLAWRAVTWTCHGSRTTMVLTTRAMAAPRYEVWGGHDA